MGDLRREIGPAECAADVRARPGRFVELTVRDEGEGMSPEVQARLFEPFFSTKLGGAGIGLGLMAVDAFARQSGGRARVTTAPGLGTTVTLELPAEGGRKGPG